MNKILKGLLLSVLILTLSFNMLPLGAQGVEDGAMPLSEIAIDTSVQLTASGSRLKAEVVYTTGANLTSAVVYTYLQKYVDGSWKAASTTATCAWKDESTAVYGHYDHYFTMTESGYYRAKVVFYFYGTNNAEDRIEEYDHYTYVKP